MRKSCKKPFLGFSWLLHDQKEKFVEHLDMSKPGCGGHKLTRMDHSWWLWQPGNRPNWRNPKRSRNCKQKGNAQLPRPEEQALQCSITCEKKQWLPPRWGRDTKHILGWRCKRECFQRTSQTFGLHRFFYQNAIAWKSILEPWATKSLDRLQLT